MKATSPHLQGLHQSISQIAVTTFVKKQQQQSNHAD
jgi:hypothetical protein